MPYQRQTLLMKRLKALPKELSRVKFTDAATGLVSGWKIIDNEPDTPWRSAILTCYDLITSTDGIGTADFRNTVYAIAAPLNQKGGIVGDIRLPESQASGKDTLVQWDTDEEPGNCAERKILSRRGQDWTLSDVWIFYTTSSPCTFCTDKLVEGFQRGNYKHLVIAFENCYQPNENRSRGLPDPSVVQGRIRDSYDPDDPGIEFFKVCRTLESCHALQKQLEQLSSEEQAAFQSPLSTFDNQLSVVRVNPAYKMDQ